MSREKNIILTARVMSMVFTPFYLPIVGLLSLFFLSYLSLMPLGYKLQVLTLVYFFTILLPTVLIHLYRKYNGCIPHFMGTIVSAALAIQIVCALVNVWWKISTHTSAIGGVAGALFVFGELFAFNPIWWLCLVFILAGMLGTSRMILRQHSLAQVVAGFLVGLVCSVLGLLYL